MKHRWFRIIAGVGLLGSTAVLSASAGTASAAQSGGTLSIGVGADISTTIPWLIEQTGTRAILGQIYSPLFDQPLKGTTVVPDVASGYKLSNGGRTYTITLRKGVMFDNGTKVTAADVVWTLKKDKTSPDDGSSLSNLISITAKGTSVVVLKLKAAQPDLLLTMATPDFGVVPANYGGESQAKFSAHPIGTGPFELKSRVVGTEISLVKNPDYWVKGEPKLAAVNYDVYADVNSESLAFKSGAIDLVADAPLDALASFSGGHLLHQTANSDSEILQINQALAPMNSYDLRKAISEGINRTALAKNLLDGHGTPSEALLGPATFPYGVPHIKNSPYVFNLAGAKSALAASTYSSGKALSLIYSTGVPGDSDLAQAIQAELGTVGIKINLEPLESTTWLKAVTTSPGTWDLSLSHADDLTPSAQLGFVEDSGYFGGGWPTKDAAAALTAYDKAKTLAQEQKVLAAYEQHIATYLPAIPVVNRQLIYVASSSLHGVTLGSTEEYSLATASVS